MFLDRADNRKENQANYRQQLKIQMEKSRVLSNKQRMQYRPQNQKFGLIATIEKQQQERKRKNQEYYQQLRSQIEEQKRMKKQEEQFRKKKELEEQQKMRKDREMLQQRYEQQHKMEQKKGRAPPDQFPQEPTPIKQGTKSKKEPTIKQVPPQNLFKINNRLDVDRSGLDNGAALVLAKPIPMKYYSRSSESEGNGFGDKRNFKDNYYQELLGQRRRLEEEAGHISELNRFFNTEKYKKRQEGQSLQQMRALQKMLDQKNSQLMEFDLGRSRNESGLGLVRISKVKSVGARKEDLRVKDEWRKLD